MAGRRAAAPQPRPGKALRWVDGVGTCLVPCTILERTGYDWQEDEIRGWRIRYEDGTETRLHSDYVLP